MDHLLEQGAGADQAAHYHREGASEEQSRVGHPGVRSNDEDWAARFVLRQQHRRRRRVREGQDETCFHVEGRSHGAVGQSLIDRHQG